MVSGKSLVLKSASKNFQVRLDHCANQAKFTCCQAGDDDAIVGNLDPVTRFFLSQRKQPPVASA